MSPPGFQRGIQSVIGGHAKEKTRDCSPRAWYASDDARGKEYPFSSEVRAVELEGRGTPRERIASIREGGSLLGPGRPEPPRLPRHGGPMLAVILVLLALAALAA